MLPRHRYRMPRWPALPLACLLLSGCGLVQTAKDAPASPAFTPRPTVAVASAGAGDTQQVSIGAANTRFVPQVIRAHPGKLVITFHNDESDVHNLTVFTTPEEDVGSGSASSDAVSTGTVNGHQTSELTVTLPKAGTYKFFCRFHREEGMFGEIQVH